MYLKVIYSDLSMGAERAGAIQDLTKSGKIIAVHCSEGWVEVRRKSKEETYKGIDRRRNKSESFFAQYPS